MICPNCNSYFPDMENSCPYCGRPTSKEEKKYSRMAAKTIWEQEQKRRDSDPFLRAKIERQRAADQRAVSAVIVSVTEDHSKSVLGLASRGFIGGLIAGPFGTAVGLLSTKDRVKLKTVTFAVEYASGRKGTETVKAGSKRYDELMMLTL